MKIFSRRFRYFRAVMPAVIVLIPALLINSSAQARQCHSPSSYEMWCINMFGAPCEGGDQDNNPVAEVSGAPVSPAPSPVPAGTTGSSSNSNRFSSFDGAGRSNTPSNNAPSNISPAPVAAPAPPPLASGGPPAASVNEMVLTFADEFNRVSASSDGKGTMWQTRFWYNKPEKSNWVNLDLDPVVCNLGLSPYSTSDGILNIHARPSDSRLRNCGVSHPYTSGNLYSYQSFSQQYGYFEIRAKVSDVHGTIFSFWMLPKDGSWPPEIDAPEILGREASVIHLSNHTGKDNRTLTFYPDVGMNLAEDFHTYGVMWDSQNITYYFDGRQMARTPTQADQHKPFYLIVGLGVGACGDGWSDCPRNPGSFSADAKVDYVRVWQFLDRNPAACTGDCNVAVD
ncbi:MAG: family 16 glycosylhydrolase [Bdellovibrionales bacterium]